ncbi:MAG: phosphate/phosphite/phosphonate ABC transporter substrate-binding protein [Nitrospirae bacterium]|nr:phosphate/phosphite/phosphonate ABC transporter substrate-binding protein [Nitrospirota bacterium]
MKRYATTVAALVLLLIISGCKQGQQSTGPRYGVSPSSQNVPVYHFAVHPLHNPAKLIQAYQPLVDYLNKHINGARFTLEASRDYANFEVKYQSGKPEFLLPNPWQTLQAMKTGYRVIAIAGEPEDFKGIFLVRRDSGIRKPSDLKGKAVSYPSPTALAACIMPQYFLHVHGINVNRDIENRYVGSQESSIMNVHLKNTAAGATWPPPWRAFQKDHPQEAAELKVLWETEPLINNSVMIRSDLPADIREQVRKYLVGLHETEEGRAILAGMETARFIPASDKDYDVVRSYVERFEREVRKVETK